MPRFHFIAYQHIICYMTQYKDIMCTLGYNLCSDMNKVYNSVHSYKHSNHQ